VDKYERNISRLKKKATKEKRTINEPGGCNRELRWFRTSRYHNTNDITE
jgi:hypothetical protein